MIAGCAIGASRGKFSPSERRQVKLPQVVQLAIIVVLAAEHVKAVFMDDCCMACSLLWLGSGLICRLYDSPLMKLEVKLADQVDPFAVAEAAEDNNFAAIVDEACCVLIDARGQRIRLFWRSARADGIPVERL